MSSRERHEKAAMRRNVRRAVELATGAIAATDTQVIAYLKGLGVATGNAQRIMDSDSSPQLSSIVDISARLGVSLAALFAHETEDEALTAAVGWPLKRITPEDWGALEDWQRIVVEDGAAMKLRELRSEGWPAVAASAPDLADTTDEAEAKLRAVVKNAQGKRLQVRRVITPNTTPKPGSGHAGKRGAK